MLLLFQDIQNPGHKNSIDLMLLKYTAERVLEPRVTSEPCHL